MRTEIAVRLTMSRKPGEMLLAPTILQIPLPKFQEPELITISKEKS